MSSLTYSVEIDRASATFNFHISYTIDGYSDPETGEYFGDTRWNAFYARTGQAGGGFSGYAAESESVVLELGLERGDYSLTFDAMNTFSGESVAGRWAVFSIAFDATPGILTGSALSDVMIGGAGDDQISALGGNDILDGGDGDDTLEGGAGADYLVGGPGHDTMIGGADDDLYQVESGGDVVVELQNGGHDTVRTSVSHWLAANVEGLVLEEAAGAIDGSGNGAANRITGNGAANRLSGLGGSDELRGAGGNDTLLGGAGDDVLDGGAGNDTMDGGAGDDVYLVDARADLIVGAFGDGTDLVRVAGLPSYTLGAHLENLSTSGSAAFRGVGNALNNRITGGAGNDVLDGAAGADILEGAAGNDWLIGGGGADGLRGGAGVDTASYVDSSAAVSVNLQTGNGTGGSAAGDTLHDVENVTGSAFDDHLTGDAPGNILSGGLGRDTLTGGAGNDVLAGGAGADILHGGADLDTLSYAGSSAGAVTINLRLGTAAGGDAQGDIYTGIEHVTAGDGNDDVTGNNSANNLTGGLGSDRLNGWGGDDVLRGGAGADILQGESGSDTASYAGSSAAVTVNLRTLQVSGGDAQGDTLTSIENAVGSDHDDVLTGSNFANVLSGGAGADILFGGGGDDRITGGAGADALDGGAGDDTLRYNGATGSGVAVYLTTGLAYGSDGTGDTFAGFENVEGSDLGDVLIGDDHANRLYGGAGYDLLDGGAGDDILYGGSQEDVFIFGTGYGHDRIADFLPGTGYESVLFLLGEAFDTFEEVMSVASSTGAANEHTVFRFDAATSLTLLDVNSAALSAGDFAF